MSNFIVSARKYRPVRFDDVVGQGHVSSTLKSAIANDHLAHAFLFCGPRGVGKTTCARILAKMLNCEQVTSDHEPCGTCNSCQSFANNASLNIYELDAASNNSVDHIRSLTEQVRFAPQVGQYKIYIIDEVHMLSPSAFNAFLKTLEEPPSYAIFILATTEKHKIIPTILSRCQIFDFKRITIVEMVDHLRQICRNENIEAEDEALTIIAQKADGALRDALSIFDRIVSSSPDKLSYKTVIDTLNILDYDYFFSIVDELLKEDMAAVLLLFNQITRLGFAGDIFLNGLASHIRDLLMTSDTKTHDLLEVSDSIKAKYKEQVKRAPKALLLSILSILNECDIHYKTALNKRLHVELALIRMTYIRRAKEVTLSGPTDSTTDANQKKKVVEPETSQTIHVSNDAKVTQTSSKGDHTKPTKTEVTKAESSKTESTSDETKGETTSSNSGTETEQDTHQIVNKQSSETNDNNTSSTTIKKQSLGLKKNLLDSLKGEVLEDIKSVKKNTKTLNIENAKDVWNTYLNTITSKHIRSLLTTTNLYIKDNQSSTITFVCQSSRAKDAILKDGSLRKQMVDTFNLPSIQFEFDIQQTEIKPKAKPKVPQSDREKYIHFLNLNPQLKALQKEFELLPKKTK